MWGLGLSGFGLVDKAVEFQMVAAEVAACLASCSHLCTGDVDKQVAQLIASQLFRKVSPLNASSSNDCRLWLKEAWLAIHWKVTISINVWQPFHMPLRYGFEASCVFYGSILDLSLWLHLAM